MSLLTSITDYFQSLSPWTIFSIGLGLATVIFLVIYLIIFSHYRSKKLSIHEIRIDFDGGVFQGSSEELVLKGKLGQEIDISRIRPVKDGYRFNGFNVYKKYVSSTIQEDGISKSMVTKEELDGVDKSIVIVPDYDLYFLASYSPLSETPALNLASDKYYPDFMNFEDLIADLKHLNADKVNYPTKINFKRTSKAPNIVFIFKDETICAMLVPYKSVCKVMLRTSETVESKLLTPFYQSEDVNDAMNWYSFVVIYNTKPTRFIKSFKETYDEVDSSLPTSEIEFNLILGSLSNLADPVLDRAVLIVDKYEKDKTKNPVPEYVLNRELPPELDEQGEPKKNNFALMEAEKEEKEEVKEEPAEEVKPVLKEEVKPINKEEKEEPKPEVKEEVKPVEVKEEPKKVEEVKKVQPRPTTITPVQPIKEPEPVVEEKPVEEAPKAAKPLTPIRPIPVHARPNKPIKPINAKKEEPVVSPLDFKPKANNKKPIGPVAIKHVDSNAAGLLTPETKEEKAVFSSEAPKLKDKPKRIFTAPKDDTNKKKRRKRRKSKKSSSKKEPEFKMEPIDSTRRIPKSNKPRKKDEPISRQIAKPKRKKNRSF